MSNYSIRKTVTAISSDCVVAFRCKLHKFVQFLWRPTLAHRIPLNRKINKIAHHRSSGLGDMNHQACSQPYAPAHCRILSARRAPRANFSYVSIFFALSFSAYLRIYKSGNHLLLTRCRFVRAHCAQHMWCAFDVCWEKRKMCSQQIIILKRLRMCVLLQRQQQRRRQRKMPQMLIWDKKIITTGFVTVTCV